MTGAPAALPTPDPQAQAALEEGLCAFHAGDLAAAHAAFGRAHRQIGRDPRCLSWHGVTLVLVERNSNLGVQLCDQALRLQGPDPELLLNLARVQLALHQRERALQSVDRALELWPGDERLRAARAALGLWQDPVLPFLPRRQALNRILGWVRRRWRARRGPAGEPSPASLGVIAPHDPAEGRS